MNEVKRTDLDKRADRRGWVVNPMVPPFPDVPLGQVHIASLEPGAVRGNHYHPKSAEFVMVWGGRAQVVWQTEDGGLAREDIGEDDTAVFEIPPGVVHAVTNVGDDTVYLVAYYLGPADGEWPDTERSDLV